MSVCVISCWDAYGLLQCVNSIPSLSHTKRPPPLLCTSVFGQLDLVFTFSCTDPLTDIFPIHSVSPSDHFFPSLPSPNSTPSCPQALFGREKKREKTFTGTIDQSVCCCVCVVGSNHRKQHWAKHSWRYFPPPSFPLRHSTDNFHPAMTFSAAFHAI